MKYIIELGELPGEVNTDGEQLTANATRIIKQLLSASAERQLQLKFAPENLEKISEEIGFRRALTIFASYFNENET